MEMTFNKYQTSLTEELLNSLPEEVRNELLDIINNVKFVQNLISPTRQYAKDRPRDDKGRIIVDLCNPHILENMDYFRETALFYKKHGRYTLLRPNGNPASEYGRWLRRERDRCWNGMIRPEDGEWIPGALYFYLNYCPIIQNVRRPGTKQADRVVDFPKIWEGIYWRFHYMDQARNGGLYNNWKGALNGAELASRSKSKSYSMAAILSRNFILGESSLVYNETRSIVTAYQKEFLTKDGILNKFVSIIDHCAQTTEFPSKRVKNSLDKMNWRMGFIDLETGTEKGTKNEVVGVTSKDDISKLRGKRAIFLGIEEFGCHIKGTEVLMYDGTLRKVEDVRIGDLLMGDDNTPRVVQKLYNGTDKLYKVTLSNGDYQIVNSHHPIYFKLYHSDTKTYTDELSTAPRLMENNSINHFIVKALVHFKHQSTPIDPYLYGTQLIKQIQEGTAPDCIPKVYKINSPEVQSRLLKGIFESLSSPKDTQLEIKSTISLLKDIKFVCECRGIRCSLSRSKPESVLSVYYEDPLDSPLYYNFTIKPYAVDEYYGFTVDKNHLFVLGDLTVTHNTFPSLAELYTVLRPIVRDGNEVFGLMYLMGTAGDKESDFAGAQEIMYNPDGFDMYSLPNVYDKTSQGKPKFVFFFPGYVNYAGNYDENGVSDVIASLIDILQDRYRVKYNSTDPNIIVKTIAEIPITPSEAILRTKRNIFPTTDLMERLSQLDSDPNSLSDVYVGTLTLRDGIVDIDPTKGTAIRQFPHKDNKLDGAVEIFTMPQKISTESGLKIPSGRYIGGLDPVDDDVSETSSLQSAFILDLWTDTIVAEYTGRPQFAEDYYEQLRRLLLYYNATLLYENNKKGIFAYFSKMNSLHLLSDVPEYLKDRELVKGALIGNKSKGCPATLPINNFARTLIRDWLLKPVTVIIKEGEGEQEIQVANLYRLRQRALIQELSQWNSEGNFDRVSALGMLMLLREEKLILCGGDTRRIQITKPKTLADDPYFSENYKESRSKNKGRSFIYQ